MRIFSYIYQANGIFDKWDEHYGVVFDDGVVVVSARGEDGFYDNIFQMANRGEESVKRYYKGLRGELLWEVPTVLRFRYAKRFLFLRLKDVTGVSGEGVVAQGVQFADGRAVLRWCVGTARSTVIWDSVSDAVSVHGHDGNTVLEWLD